MSQGEKSSHECYVEGGDSHVKQIDEQTPLRQDGDTGAENMSQSMGDGLNRGGSDSDKPEASRPAITSCDHLMAIVAHDLRNALSLALLSLSACETLGETPNGSTLAARIALVRKGLKRMQRLIDDLQDLSSVNTGHLSLVLSTQSVAALIDEVIEMFREAAEERGIRLVGLPLVDGCHIECDGLRLLQVFSNLVGNALKFTPSGGEICVAASDCDPDIEFKVSDTGSGINPPELPHVFEPYCRGNRVRSGGLGLGLSIAKGIVVAHGGRIWGESQLGQGTTFYFRIPKRGDLGATRIQD